VARQYRNYQAGPSSLYWGEYSTLSYSLPDRQEHSEPFPGGEYKDGEGSELSEIEDENKHSLAV